MDIKGYDINTLRVNVAVINMTQVNLVMVPKNYSSKRFWTLKGFLNDQF